jgi:hypothetical protein
MTATQLLQQLQDYMFTDKNLIRYTKHMIQPQPSKEVTNQAPVLPPRKEHPLMSVKRKPAEKRPAVSRYLPKQKDSLFWCFYILKNGYSNYEMEINNQYFVVEKSEKFKYIDTLRKNKELIKLHKIRPFSDLEDELANKERISLKTFMALCIVENLNILLIDGRKTFELECADITEQNPVHIIHRNSKTNEHSIELNVTDELLKQYRETYYKMESIDAKIKSIGTYKVDELLEMCKKLNIELNHEQNKMKKADIYERLLMNY